MALAASHIRFALDVKDKYKVTDIQKYVSGAIYPDSRYVAKIDRHLTHPDTFMEWDVLNSDDFQKGWYIHLLYDKIQEKVVAEKFPSIASLPEHKQGTEWWLCFTAIKILQDMDDVHKFDIAECLPMLDYAENPCGEDIEKVKEYNRIFQTLYNDTPAITINSYGPVWKALGLSDDSVKELNKITEDYKNDTSTMELVNNIYSETLLEIS